MSKKGSSTSTKLCMCNDLERDCDAEWDAVWQDRPDQHYKKYRIVRTHWTIDGVEVTEEEFRLKFEELQHVHEARCSGETGTRDL